MGECLLVRRGGGKATLKGISVKTPPTKIQYLEGEAFDFSGMVISANLSGTLVDIMSGYTCTPTVMGANDTTVTISYTVNGKTATTTQVMQKAPYKPVLAENTWPQIIDACADGHASILWQVGDEKTFDFGGTTLTAVIIGKNHDDLDSTDAKYGDGTYNSGTGKAALTFQIKELLNDYYKMNTYESNTGGWTQSYMRITTMPQLKQNLPVELREALRVVTKHSQTYYGGIDIGATADSLFLPSRYEVFASGNSSEGAQYAYYAAGNSRIKRIVGTSNADTWWLRSIGTKSNIFLTVDEKGSNNTYIANASSRISFCFCL